MLIALTNAHHKHHHEYDHDDYDICSIVVCVFFSIPIIVLIIMCIRNCIQSCIKKYKKPAVVDDVYISAL